jgi:nucleotide-binding universal stress UspA family protein
VTEVTIGRDPRHGGGQGAGCILLVARWVMETVHTGTRIALKNILYLTDFSEPSEAALPFGVEIARNYGAKVHVLHVLVPPSNSRATPELAAREIERQEENAEAEMQRIESQLAGLTYEATVERAVDVWAALEQAIKDDSIDLIVLGTHGRTGAQKFLMGSVAEEIFRLSPVPVLTIGPWVRRGLHNDARFHRVLFPTDFSLESMAAAPYAISLAQENQARLVLLHVIPRREAQTESSPDELSVADGLYQLDEMVPKGAELWCRPDSVIQYGDPVDRILDVTKERGVDLIVLGVRSAAGRLDAATHLERSTAHKIVAHAVCPVLTVRG